MRTTSPIGIVLTTLLGVLSACAEAASIPPPTTNAQTPDGQEPENPDAPGTTDPDGVPSGALIKGLAITEIALFQAVKVPIVAKGAWVKSRNAPVVANRPALVRVHVTPKDGWEPQDVTAELRLASGTTKFPVIKETKRITVTSTDESAASTFNLEVPPESLPPGVTIEVALRSTAESEAHDTPSNDEARFPRQGSAQDLAVEVSGKLTVVVVPVKYDADGSGRTPDVTPGQLELYRQTFMSRYPATEVEVKAHAVYPWSSTIARNGAGFSTILNAIARLRQQERPAPNVYYYGALAPAASMNQYCVGGCVAGLSALAESPNASYLRASVGLGFSGQSSANTAAHEIGHAHGREHAPCGNPDAVDPEYPYQGGQIGVWGYDMFKKTFISPTKGRDMMGYCPNEWISDYTFGALFDRIAKVNVEKPTTTNAKGAFRIANVGASGDLTWDGDIELDEPTSGGVVREVSYLNAEGMELGRRSARFHPYDHLPGGILFVPQDASPWVYVREIGSAMSLTR